MPAERFAYISTSTDTAQIHHKYSTGTAQTGCDLSWGIRTVYDSASKNLDRVSVAGAGARCVLQTSSSPCLDHSSELPAQCSGKLLTQQATVASNSIHVPYITCPMGLRIFHDRICRINGKFVHVLTNIACIRQLEGCVVKL